MSGHNTFESLEPRRLLSGSITSNAALIGLTEEAPASIRQPFGIGSTTAPGTSQSPGNPQVTIPLRESARGVFTSVQPGFAEFSGSGVASFFGRYSIVGSNGFDDQGNVLNGQFTTTAADGSTISGVFAGTYTLLGGTAVRYDVEVEWQAGTGRLAGVTGTGSVVAVAEAIAPGAGWQYVTRGALRLPG